MVGIVGGLGPFAGAHFFQLLLKKTPIVEEVDHIPAVLISDPNIADRSDFLEGKSSVNPAHSIISKIEILKNAGAQVIAIPCNQIFTPAIFGEIISSADLSGLQILNLVEELHKYINENYATINEVGVFARTGACKHKIFDSQERGLNYLPSELQNKMDMAIASKEFGLKYHSSPSSAEANSIISECLNYFKGKNISTIVLGCTELSLAIDQKSFPNFSYIDTNEVLALATINAHQLLIESSKVDIKTH